MPNNDEDHKLIKKTGENEKEDSEELIIDNFDDFDDIEAQDNSKDASSQSNIGNKSENITESMTEK